MRMEENVTPHAQARMAQRAIRLVDVDLIVRIGTEVEGGYFVREKDAQAEICRLKRALDQVNRISGKRIVLAGDQILTAYHARPAKERRLLRYIEKGETKNSHNKI